MSNANAQLLDELMGRNRNATEGDDIHPPHWSDDEVCTYFLCGFCPNELFTNTKADLGPCIKMHDEQLRRDYQKSPRNGKMGFEEEFVRYLRTIVTEVERRIKRGRDRIVLNSSATANDIIHDPRHDERLERLDTLGREIDRLVVTMEKLGNEGNISEAQEVNSQMEKLRREKDVLEQAEQQWQATHKELEVCDICGAFRIKDDAPSRQEEHLQGKMHIGYSKIRDHIAEFENTMESRRRERLDELERDRLKRELPPAVSSASRGRDTSLDGYRRPPRDSDRDRRDDRYRRDRSRSREHKSSKKRDRSRSRDRNKRSSRDKSRDRKHSSRSKHRRDSPEEKKRKKSRSNSRNGDDKRHRKHDKEEETEERRHHKSHRRRSKSREEKSHRSRSREEKTKSRKSGHNEDKDKHVSDRDHKEEKRSDRKERHHKKSSKDDEDVKESSREERRIVLNGHDNGMEKQRNEEEKVEKVQNEGNIKLQENVDETKASGQSSESIGVIDKEAATIIPSPKEPID